MPLVLFTGMATATLYVQAVENDAIEASGLDRSVEDRNLETLTSWSSASSSSSPA